MKHKKLRGVVAMLLTLVMVVGLLPTSVYAADADGGGNSVVVESVSDSVEVGKTDSGDGDLVYNATEDTKSPDDSENSDSPVIEDEVKGGADKKDASKESSSENGQSAPVEAKSEAGKDEDVKTSVTEEGLQDPYAGEDTPVSVSVLYGSAQNAPRAISAMRAPARASGTITTGDDMSYNSEWLTEFSPYSSAVVKYFNGQPAYCIEPHKGAPGSGTSVDASDFWGNDTVRLALAYGYGGVDDSTLLSYARNGTYAWCATQEVIWEIVGGYRDLSDLFIGPNHSYDADVAVPISNAHDYIWRMINQQSTIPSFAVRRPTQTYNDIELSWDGSKWTATEYDSNRVLPSFEDFTFNLAGVETIQSGYNLTINATAEAAKSMLNGIVSNPSEGNVIDPDSVNAYVLVAGGGKQDCVALNGWPDPVTAYVRAKVTKTTGDLTIAKTSEDGKAGGVSFTVTGPNGFSKTVTTAANGKITIADLQPGTYTVTEKTSENYIPTTSQTVTIAIGDVKTVSFNNVLKKGTVKITKMSEDGQVAGHTFRLSGTSAAGTSVNMTATTDANGVATFNNVPIGKNYKLEEINTAAKYVVPEVQAGVVVEYNAATEAKFENKLARGNLKITKTSEDGFVSGMTFRLSGTSISGAAVNETATTDENGVILFKDILIGNNYTVQEINTAERYVVPAIQEGVTISLNKTTNLQFENKLARGAVEVKKTSEDGKTAGITFRLYGTAINGETVDMTAVTDANGIATFNNVLIGNNYSVEEVNTAAKYVVPEVKAGVKVTLGNTTDVEVYNKLKRGDLRVTKTSEDGLVEGITFRLYGTAISGDAVDMTATTNADGVAIFKDVLIGNNYTLEEVDTAVKYVIPAVQEGLVVEYQKTTDTAVSNVLKKWKVTVEKTDAETGNIPRGDGVFEGAVYGLYKGDELVKEYVIGSDGKFTTDEYICGYDYTIREIKAPSGYQIDEGVYRVGAEPENYRIEHNVAPQITSVEVINRGTFAITKFISDGTSGPAKFEGGAEFKYWLQSAGSYENAKGDERGILTTNDLGYSGKSIELPYGTYVVHQTKAGDKGAGLAPEFTVLVGEVDRDHHDLAVNNGPITAYLRVVKVDEFDGEVIPWGGAEFQIYDPDGNKVSQKVTYPTVKYIDTFVTNDEGYFVTPLVLPYGEGYHLVETKAPKGYELMDTPIRFDVTPDTISLDAETGLVTVSIVAEDEAVTPKVKTTATDKDGNKEIIPSTSVTIIDKVECTDVIPNKTYTVEGYLVVKSTGEPLLDAQGNRITASKTFKAEADFTGYVELEFTFDASLLGGESLVAFEDLKRGEKVVATHADINDVDQTVTVLNPKIGTTAKNSAGGKEFMPLDDVILVDTISYENMPVGKEFIAIGTLMDKATGKPVTDAKGEPITAYKGFTPEQATGTVDVKFVFNATELAGKSLVVFERVYLGNEIVPGDSDKPVFVSHEDINDEGQTVTIGVPEIGTKAVNNATNGKTLDPEARAEIKDTVSYKGLIAGEKYTVSGKLMNKATNEPLKDKDGKEITASTTFTAEASKGTVDVIFVLDASLLRGESIVVFESLQYKDIEIAVHADINDADQTVTVNNPEIKTSAKNAADGKKEFWAYSKVELIDTVSYKGLIAGNKYTVTGTLMDKATGKPVLGRNNKEITATTEFEAKSADGTVDVSFVFDASILGGKTLVVFETLTRNGTTVATHTDINDVDQTVTIKRIPTYSGPSISTTATFDGKDKKNSVAGKNVKIVDTVNYTGLTVGKTYVLVGTLMDKDTGVALKDNKGNLVTATTTFTPKSSNGAVNVTFKFDASKLKDHALVVFETLYEGRAEAGNVIATHNDLMDGAQTVYFRDSVQTGDDGIGLWAMLSTFSAIACCATAMFMFRRKKEQFAE